MRQVRTGILAALALVAAGAVPGAADESKAVYKMVVKDQALYGTPVDAKHFRTCGGMVIEQPNNARIERVSGSCPAVDGVFLPHSGHAKLPLPRATGSRAPSPRPS